MGNNRRRIMKKTSAQKAENNSQPDLFNSSFPFSKKAKTKRLKLTRPKRLKLPERRPSKSEIITFIGGFIFGFLFVFLFLMDAEKAPQIIYKTPEKMPVEKFIPEEPHLEETTVIKPAAPIVKPAPQKHIPLWQKNALPTAEKIPTDAKVIALVIDDMGIDKKRTKEISELPAPLTTSFITYASHLPEQMTKAKKDKKELMLHIPMQPANPKVDSGPNTLKTDMDAALITQVLQISMPQELLDIGVVGINNHMGSLFTADEKSMKAFLHAFKPYDLFFIDSVTSKDSVGLKLADKEHIAAASRNIFIDNEDDENYILGQLKKLEDAARENGFAIGIGHPHDGTIKALKKWLPTLKAKQLYLVPASYVVTRRLSEP